MKSVVQRASGLVLIVVALGLPIVPAARAANAPPKLAPIQAAFDEKAFATTYSAAATDPDGDKLALSWQLAAPAQDPGCSAFATLAPAKAIWHHGDKDGCNHAVQGPRGHTGTVKFTVFDGTWTCTESYAGTLTGPGPANAVCKQGSPPPQYTCTGPQVKLFDSSNFGGVLNGAKAPSFSTKGKLYCLGSITTYHWNNGQGKAPGTLGLTALKPKDSVGPYRATGSSGQGGAPNVNWTVNAPKGAPVVLFGIYSCNDSDAASWAQNSQSGGTGFCTVYATSAVKTGAGTATTPAPTKKPPAPAPGAAKKGGKLSIKALPDTGKSPLAVTFALSSPKVVQWRVDFGDGQSRVAIGQPPSSLAHTYTANGDYRPRLTVIASANATAASSATTSVQVGTALLSFTAAPASGNPPLRVTFTLGTAVRNITTWAVDFGDGQRTGGGGKPPGSVSHTYSTAGSFRAVFSVKPGAYALVAAFAQVTVGGGTPPTLSLSATPTSGKHPVAITFTLGTTVPGQIVSWQLQFGDGQRAGGSGKPPATVAHSYSKAGTFAAFLIVAQQQRYGGVQYIVPRGGLVISIR